MGGQASPPAPPLPSALAATHAPDADDKIQLTTKPRSHHSALRGKRGVAKCAGRSIDPALRHVLDGDEMPNASQNRAFCGRQGQSWQAPRPTPDSAGAHARGGKAIVLTVRGRWRAH
jgi:hypothetical protein